MIRWGFLLVLVAAPVWAQQSSLIRVAPFEDSRLGGIRLIKNGAELELGFFGEEAPAFFQGCALCEDELVRVKGLRITGLVLGVTGPVGMLAGLVVGLAAGALFPILPIALLGGAVISIGGVLFNQLADTFLLRAVNLYNLQVLEPPKRQDGFSATPGNSSPER